MSKQETRTEKAARLYLDRLKARAQMQHAQEEVPYGNDPVNRKTEDELFNERAPVAPEQELAWWAEADRLKMPEDMAKAYVGMRLYPARGRLAKSEDRALDPYQQARYIDKQARKTGWRPEHEMMPLAPEGSI